MKCEFVSEGAGRRLSPHNFTHLVKTGYCLQTRSSVILWIRLIHTLWVFCILLFLDWMGWRTEKTFMKFIYRAFCPLIHFLIILALPPSHSLVTDIRAAHSTLVLIKSNRNKPEPITCTARWADLGAEGIHNEKHHQKCSWVFMGGFSTSSLVNLTNDLFIWSFKKEWQI